MRARRILLLPVLLPAFAYCGLAHRAKRDSGRAHADFSEAIRIAAAPNSMFHFERGLIHEKMGDTARAVADYRAALKLGPESRTYRRALERLGAAP